MTDYLHIISQAKLAEYYDTRTDLPIRKYVLIANMLRKTTVQEEKAEEEWLDTCLNALDQQDDDMNDDNKRQPITVRHYSFTSQPFKKSSSTEQQQNQHEVNIYQIVLP
ncbi:uncharacterized protein BX664DRAFT_344191 [Halteromyces radiatus]|uniref:uncharacterized protein n=1 Tax=Halteromyces radiatus TaxID=101107 RepID=UPI002220CF90|nr:uncharacterized protein BX664DRAFT_344191 [Halteromyces radiatus]KAI8076894.1 hypothetical protein BX664DRAFT_344191 [Halteromyces radiatus]